ncbi:hypothetical protein [Scleromatobacter humisilvae]|uniref:Uncharacterized protein n=1 Tax=Scleromatobacter humisilvae TaxID=2897159 RepID=A0A9X1YEL1_9BURK|nr:hypothetical protein [Scleromatobacter humisilvae]MCK9684854.1 hypothetical protein [Scleromatobacter humisilvae]
MAPAPLTLTQLRRDRRLIWWWLPVGSAAMFLFIRLWRQFAGEPPPALYTTLDVLWIAVTFSLIARRSGSRCPKCDHRYLRAFPWMSLKKVECAVCGYKIPEA